MTIVMCLFSKKTPEICLRREAEVEEVNLWDIEERERELSGNPVVYLEVKVRLLNRTLGCEALFLMYSYPSII